MKPILSIIYVHYNTPEEIIESIKSLKDAVGKLPYEIIIIDNVSVKKIPQPFLRRIKVKLINNLNNEGFGKAVNKAAKTAEGKYILILNPDTLLQKNTIVFMINKIIGDEKIGIVGPQFIDDKGKILQSINNLPFLPDALFAFSFLNKIFPQNYYSKKYWMQNIDRAKEQEIPFIGGACMLLKKSVFEKVKGFDERFFLYFEEPDLCFRVSQAGYKIVYVPDAKVIHLVGRSLQDKELIKKYFEKSRFLFFKKYHGILSATFAELFLRFFNIKTFLLLGILGLSAFVNLYRLSQLMVFIGDQGWFYLSARDILTTGHVPLVGITASHTWLRQGPLWTYVLAVIFFICRFNPVCPGYFTAFIGVLTVFSVYKVGMILFSKKIGYIASLLFATSPLAITHARMPYHTSLIPLFAIIFLYGLYKWVMKGPKFFPLIIGVLAILYNLELATVVLWLIVFLFFIVGICKKKDWAKNIFQKRILIYSFIGFIIPMFPIIIYDVGNGYHQTVIFLGWIFYRSIRFIPSLFSNHHSSYDIGGLLSFLSDHYKYLMFNENKTIALLILFISSALIVLKLYLDNKFRKNTIAILILIATIIIPSVGFLVNNTPSEAYIPIFFPSVILISAVAIEYSMRTKLLQVLGVFIIAFIVSMNLFGLFSKDFFLEKRKHGLSFNQRLHGAQEIVNRSHMKPYTIIGYGEGSQFRSFTMNYEYLTWWLGHAPSSKSESIQIVIEETPYKVIISQ